MKAYSRNVGNKRADILAKDVIVNSSSKLVCIPKPFSRLKVQCNSIVCERWQVYWETVTTGKGLFNLVPWVCNLNKFPFSRELTLLLLLTICLICIGSTWLAPHTVSGEARATPNYTCLTANWRQNGTLKAHIQAITTVTILMLRICLPPSSITL